MLSTFCLHFHSDMPKPGFSLLACFPSESSGTESAEGSANVNQLRLRSINLTLWPLAFTKRVFVEAFFDSCILKDEDRFLGIKQTMVSVYVLVYTPLRRVIKRHKAINIACVCPKL